MYQKCYERVSKWLTLLSESRYSSLSDYQPSSA